ncbi:energy conserving hydrogenase EhbF [Methanobrevibacter sp.]|uniref:energy conserving hydrogenase EhbF n=1 Tax=Methanobrevibacter sp. TaxID=66852 RepID=UPI0025F3B3D3|nr:energy conserving hydrogenase EhbF [Methanobrevibacter sp.]MBQ6512670.1 energy conserving hydrogenase EhbF [Methanobrevibacter sp.]
MNELIPLMVIVPMMAALLISAFSKFNKVSKILAFVVAICLPIIPLLSNYGLHYFGGYEPMLDNVTSTMFHPAITYSFTFLQQIFIAMIGLLTFLVIFIYLTKYKKVSGPYLFLLFMGTAAVTAMMLTDDIFHMFVFFEILALAQVGIVAASSIDYSYEMALKYMILGSIGSPIMLLGIGFLLAITGSVNVTDIAAAVHSGLVDITSPVFLISLGLIFFGWLYASGLPPFHTIKSGIYSKAEPHGAALLQSFTVISMISIVIVMFRIYSTLPIFEVLVVFFSILAMILGVSLALTQTDFRRMIGFLAVGELGFIGLGIGLGTQYAITAGLFQALNEIIITALLFIGFGAIVDATDEVDTRKLGGLFAYHPKVSLMLLIGGLAMAGVPPLSGFQSKLMLVQASLSCGYPELSILAIMVSIATFVVFVKTFYAMFLRPKPNDLEVGGKEIPRAMIFAMGILLIIIIVLGLFPDAVTSGISNFVGGIL